MKLQYKIVLPFAISMLSHIQSALDEFDHSSTTIDSEKVIDFVEFKLQDWNPSIKGIPILDIHTKQHAIRFIAGIAINIMRGK